MALKMLCYDAIYIANLASSSFSEDSQSEILKVLQAQEDDVLSTLISAFKISTLGCYSHSSPYSHTIYRDTECPGYHFTSFLKSLEWRERDLDKADMKSRGTYIVDDYRIVESGQGDSSKSESGHQEDEWAML